MGKTKRRLAVDTVIPNGRLSDRPQSRRPQSRTLLETSTDFPLAGILFLVGIRQKGGLDLESANIVLKTLDWWARPCGLFSLFNKHKVFKIHKIEKKKLEKSVLYVKIFWSNVCLLVALYKILFLFESVGGYFRTVWITDRSRDFDRVPCILVESAYCMM